MAVTLTTSRPNASIDRSPSAWPGLELGIGGRGFFAKTLTPAGVFGELFGAKIFFGGFPKKPAKAGVLALQTVLQRHRKHWLYDTYSGTITHLRDGYVEWIVSPALLVAEAATCAWAMSMPASPLRGWTDAVPKRSWSQTNPGSQDHGILHDLLLGDFLGADWLILLLEMIRRLHAIELDFIALVKKRP